MSTVRMSDVTGRRANADFNTFFEAEYERLFQAMYLMCRNKSDAEDLAQEAMARAFERWDRVLAVQSPIGYVFQIAFNLHRSWLRRAERGLRSGRVGTSTAHNVGQARLEVLEALASLPRSQREALVLMEWLGFSADEAGEILGIDSSSVRGRVHRARNSLRQRFGDVDA
jgi:RNA polymerase sigma-70 factor (ECF subfamily)